MLYLFKGELERVLQLTGQGSEQNIERLLQHRGTETQLVLEFISSLGQTWCTVTFGKPSETETRYYVSHLGLQLVQPTSPTAGD